MKYLLAVAMVLVAVTPVGAQTVDEDTAEDERTLDALNSQLAKLEDTAGLGGEGVSTEYRQRLSGNSRFCEFFGEIQQAYPLYQNVSCQAR